MLTARAFWMVRRSVGFDAGSAPPAFTAMVRSLAMRANCFAMRFQRANIVALRTSKMRPMPAWCTNAGARAKAPRGGESTGGCAEERAFGPVRQRLGELRLQDAHAPQLPAQAALDLAQSGLKLQLLRVLARGALLLAEPLILDAGPVRERCEEALVLVRHARAHLLEVQATGKALIPGTAARARGKCDRR